MPRLVVPIKTLKNKFLFTMLVLTFLPLIIQTRISTNISKQILENNYIENYKYNLDVSSNNLDLILEPIIGVTRNIIGNKDLQSILRKESSKLPSRDFQKIETIFGLAMSQSMYIETIYLITEDTIYYKDKKNNSSGHITKINLDDIKERKWYKETAGALGKELFYCGDIMKDYIGKGDPDKQYITCTKLFRDIDYPSKHHGVLIISLRSELLDSVFSKESIEQVYANYIYDEKVDYFIDQQIEDGKYIVSQHLNKTTGWKLYNIVDRGWLGSKSNLIGRRALILAIGMFIIVCCLFIFISGEINKPLKKLERVIEKFGEGEYDFKDEFDDSEIGKISKQFLEVANKNTRLNKELALSWIKQREAEVMVLQEQINPHFLYNTLDLVYWKAQINGEEEISEIAVDLSNIFKLTLNRGELLIDVRDEIEHIRHYVNIQKKRYRERLHVEIEIEEEMMSQKVVKLLLQPIVENAICHGIEPQVEGGTIRVIGRCDKGKMIFIIADDGVGCDKKKIYQGYGLCNVEERIKLYYGDECGLTIESEEGKGTRVTIVVDKI